MSSSRAFLTVVGDTERRLRAPASPEVVHARDVARRVLTRGEREASKSAPRLQLAFVDPERMTAGEIVSSHADIDALDVWRELPSRPPEDAPLLELIGYLVRRWWRKVWR